MKTLKIILILTFICSQAFLIGQYSFAGQIGLEAEFQASSDWGTGYVGNIKVTNTSSAKTDTWTCSFNMPSGHDVTSLWGGKMEIEGNEITCLNQNWNGSINPGKSVSIGFCAKKPQGSTAELLNLNAFGSGSFEPEPVPEPEPPSGGDSLTAEYNVTCNWGSGYQIKVTLTNNTSSKCESWICTFGLVSGQQISSLWNGQYTANGSNITAENPSWLGGGVIDPGVSKSFGMIISNPQQTAAEIKNLIAYANGSSPAPPDDPPEPPQPEEPPQVPGLDKITNDDQDGDYSVSWQDVEGAEEYTLEEDIASGFDSPAIVYSGEDIEKAITNKEDGDYYYRVYAFNSYGSSEYSNIEKAVVSEDPAPPAPPSDYKVVGYFTNWAIYRNPSFKPESIAADKITHINYAFAKIDEYGNIILIDSWADVEYRDDWNTQKPYWGNFRQLYDLKQEYPHLKVLISIGGWTLSDKFSPMAADPQARSNFVQQCIEFCETYDCFDGIDIDWEYPCYSAHNGHPEDKVNYTKLLEEMYTAFKAHDPPLLLSIASPAGEWHYENMELDKIYQYLDWMNLMSYDFHGPWGGSEDSVTNHLSPLYPSQEGNNKSNVDSAVQAYLAKGVPAEKIVMGIPLYGRSYADAASAEDGLYSLYSGAGSGTTAEKGVRFFSDIKENLLDEYTQYWDTNCEVPYLHNENPQSQYYNEFISYEDELSINNKCLYVKENKLGGVMLWELGTDTWYSGNWDALSEIEKELGGN